VSFCLPQSALFGRKISDIMVYSPNSTWFTTRFFFFSILWIPAYCQSANFINPDQKLLDKFPLLATWNSTLRKSPYIGGQNFTQCCLKAITQSYVISAAGDIINNPDKSYPSLGVSADFLGGSQFPCGAAYNATQGDVGAPQVTVPYTWCRDNCGGWEQSTNSDLNQWVQPFVGFILPAAVFCLNVSAPCVQR
jgi:hypothetical protein